jgi:3D (Asp-Asp-Asp) domain-containing protein
VWYGPDPLAGQAPHQRRIAAWTAIVAAVVLLAPIAGGTGPDAGSLRAQNVQIDASRQSAALALYAIDSKLVRANADLASLRAESTRLKAERADAKRALRLARHDTRVGEHRLAERLRRLYEEGDVSPLEILLGAKSLDEALTGLDSLNRIATQDKNVLAEVKRAHGALVRLDRAIARRQARIAGLEASAAATAASLAQAKAAKTAYIGELASKRRLNEARIASVEAQSRAAQARATALVREPVVVPTSLPTTATLASAAGPAAAGTTMTVSATGYSLPGRTATGLPVGWGVVAVDPSVIPLGTRLTIPGYGEAVAADIGSAVQGSMIDVWFPTVAQAQAWGRRTITITLH